MRSLFHRLLDYDLAHGQGPIAAALGGIIGTAAATMVLACVLAFCPVLIDQVIH